MKSEGVRDVARLLVIVEGQTEETFVNEVIAPRLYDCGFHAVGARLMGNARQRSRRGGIRPWAAARSDIVRHLLSDPQVIVTTMVDYYRLPASGDDEHRWPGRAAAPSLPHEDRAQHVETAIASAIGAVIGTGFNPVRFVPFVVMHEFEGLLFSDCRKFAASIGRNDLVADFTAIRGSFDTPEDINDSPATHPSKRIEDLLPGYEKPLMGVLAALDIGLNAIRAECPHFNGWITHLEQLA